MDEELGAPQDPMEFRKLMVVQVFPCVMAELRQNGFTCIEGFADKAGSLRVSWE